METHQMKRLLWLCFLFGCAKAPVVTVPPIDPNPNHLPADILALHPKSLKMSDTLNECDNRKYKCKRGVEGYMQEGSDSKCYCVPMKCTAEKCVDLKPR